MACASWEENKEVPACGEGAGGGSRALLSTPKACRAPTKPGWVLRTGTMTSELDSQAGGTSRSPAWQEPFL